MSLSAIFIAFFWLISFPKLKFETFIKRADYLTPILLFLAYIFGALYSSAQWQSSVHIILKYSKLLLIPIIASSITDDQTRKNAMLAFIFGAILTLLISYFKFSGLLPQNMGLHDHFYSGSTIQLAHSFYAFKNTIAHGVLMSFTLYIFLTKALLLKKNVNLKWLILSFLTFYNLMYLGFSRTGQVLSIIVICYVIYRRLGVKSIVILSFILFSAQIFELQIKQFLPEKLVGINNELNDHQSNKHLTSAGERIEMYKTSLELIEKSPFIGYGTASLEYEYRKIVAPKDTLLRNVTNLHNQFLLTFVELGALGFSILIYMFYAHWKVLNRVNQKYSEYKIYIKGLVLTIMCGSLFNSLILDAGEGRFYCIMAGVILSSLQAINKNNKA
jgi:O-antigen ligase